jgi:hypothetical protein
MKRALSVVKQVHLSSTQGPGVRLRLDDMNDELLPHIEHFQLTLQEAFFLSAMLGCLEVRDYDENVSQC